MMTKTEREAVDWLATSDWHLASELCKAKTIDDMLSRFSFPLLILVGDIFDSMRLDLLKDKHFNVLKRLRKLGRHGCTIIWVRGNHDWNLADVMQQEDVLDEYVLDYAGERIIFKHGDQFDTYLDKHPLISTVATDIYWWFQRLFGMIGLGKIVDDVCRWAKSTVKSYIQAKKHVADGAIEYARLSGGQRIICGHIHHAENVFDKGIHYNNIGCATENPITFITGFAGKIRRHHLADGGEEVQREILPK